MSARLPLAALCLILAGCHLVDQRDFDASAGQPPVAKALRPGPPSVPSLVTIRYTTAEPQYREAVAALVAKALSRKRDVLFTVTTFVPAAARTGEQADQAAAASQSGRQIAQAIVDDGAEPGQVEQVVRVDPSLQVREVHIDIR